MSLRRKILMGYGIAFALMCLVLMWAVANLVSLGKASDAILRENYKSILAAENMIDAIERQDSAALIGLTGYSEEGLTQFKENENNFLQWLGRAKDNITIEEETDIINNIEKDYSVFLTDFTHLSDKSKEDKEQASKFYHEKMLPVFQKVRDKCVNLRDVNQDAMFQTSSAAGKIAARAIWSTAGIGVAVLILGIGFSFWLSERLVSPLRNLMLATKKVGEGDYGIRVVRETDDELGRLATEFNSMTEKLDAFNKLNIEHTVAEQKKSEAILASIEDGIIVVDTGFNVTNINTAAENMFKVKAKSPKEKHFLEIVNNDILFSYLKKCAETGRCPIIEEEKKFLTIEQGSKTMYISFAITPIYSRDGSMQGIVLLFRDVTHLKELDRLKSEFVMAASHELRTPLTSIGMSVDLLLESAMSKLSEKEGQLLTAAHEELQRMKALVNDLLDLSKIEAGKIELEFEPVSMESIAGRITSVFQTQVAEKSIELLLQIPPALPRVKADINKITWVLTNLVSNAMRYVSGGGHIWITAERAGYQMHISVRDDGPGIPVEYQLTIFHKFVQIKGDAQAGGSGLGLAICKEIVRAHGGTIWVDSVSGHGSTFTFTLPIIDEGDRKNGTKKSFNS